MARESQQGCTDLPQNRLYPDNIYQDPCHGVFTWQSDNDVSLGTAEDSTLAELTTGTLSFLEKPSGYSVGFAAGLPPESYADATPDVSLSDFFKRPAKIFQYTWNESDAVGATQTFSPWQLFFNTSAISNKLLNYAWLKCDLKLKVMVNASPFYYGTTLMTYQPLPQFHAGGITNDAGTRYIIPQSQRPHVWIYPQNNEGGEITLPFIWPKNWLSTVSNQDFLDMGTVNFINLIQLASANGAVGTGVTVSVYAWAENVVVSGPTTGLLLQSDEYGKTPISSMASAVAATMKSLSKVPIIGKYATATQLGAQAVAAVASSLGFSNTPVISNVVPFKPTMMPPLASTEIGYPVEKLTVDPKNELSVDPSIVGLPSNDELSIQNLISKESYLTNFPWSTSASADALLFSTAITPIMFDMDALTNAKLYMTPMGWVGQMFQFWRGDVIIRLRFICTQYHRGRVRVTYDPSGSSAQNVLNTVATQTTCFNEVIDLTKDTNIEIRVPYNQALAWCQTFVPTSASQIPFTVGSGTIFNHVPGVTNGTLAVRCVTSLTAPVASSTIACIVSVRAAENLEFASPSDIQARYSYFQTQSDQYEETEAQQIIAGHAGARAAPGRFLVNHGEQVVSLRQLLRRYNFYRGSLLTPNLSSTQIKVLTELFYRFPLSPGYDPTGINTAVGLISALPAPFNYVTNTYLTWLSAAFLGTRGSINYTLNVDALNPIKTMNIARQTITKLPAFVSAVSTLTVGSNSANASFLVYTAGLTFSGAGTALNNQLTNSTLSVQLPMYSAYKFNTTTPSNASATVSQDDTSTQNFRFTLISDKNVSAATGQASAINWYVAAGTDFGLHFFLNVPTIFIYATLPTPV